MSSYTYNPDNTYNHSSHHHTNNITTTTTSSRSNIKRKTPRHLLYLTLLSTLIVFGYDTVLEPFLLDVDTTTTTTSIEQQYLGNEPTTQFSPEVEGRLKRLGRRKRRVLEQRVSR